MGSSKRMALGNAEYSDEGENEEFKTRLICILVPFSVALRHRSRTAH